LIIFKSIEYKNFLSTGNTPNKILLNTHKSTLCTGFTGHGKSTLIDAIIFSLFNKPLRKLSRREKLVNSINGKHCEVIVEFTTNNKDYKVIRGLKPDKFEIYCNNELVKQEADSRDYQSYLENQILHINYKTFTQVVILGSTNYIPFMRLTTEERRSVIEDILDIKIFSAMNKVLKQKIANTNDSYNNVIIKLNNIKNNAIAQKKIINTIKTSRNEIVNTYSDDINNNTNLIKQHQLELNTLNNEIIELQQSVINHSNTMKSINDIKSKKTSISISVNNLKKDIAFFVNNETCPTCIQNITNDHKTNIVSSKSKEIENHANQLNQYEESYKSLETEVNNNLQIINKIQTLNNNINNINNKINYLTNQNIKLLDTIKQLKEKDNIDITKEEEKFNELIVLGKELNKEKTEIELEKHIHDIAVMLLKDTGIKSKIITEYIPIINQYINKYINELDLYVKFELDEQFKETIKARHRDNFEYSNFSAGESQKLDLAILFTWRHIAKIKNSCNTNLLIMDEVLDGHLDNESTLCLLEVFKQYEDVNLFVISHSPGSYIDSFDNHLRIKKHNEFSIIT